MVETSCEGLSRRVHVLLGALDQLSFHEARIVLRNFAARPGTTLEVDLSQTDDRHHVRVFSLMSEAARTAHAADNHVVALYPPAAMVTSLTAVGVRVRLHAHQQDAPDEVVRVEDALTADGTGPGPQRRRRSLWTVSTRADPRARVLSVPVPRSAS